MKLDKADAVIIGAGAAGGVVAKELCSAGLRVVLLERGPQLKIGDFRLHDELATRSPGPPNPDYRPADKMHPREFRNQVGEDFRVIYPQDGSYAWMGGVVGGGQINYAGLMWRRPPGDFRMKATYGHVAGTTIEDWPLSYEDLEPCYERAALGQDLEPGFLLDGPGSYSAGSLQPPPIWRK
jgi:choline dehydrogenase-like flavoprotein